MVAYGDGTFPLSMKGLDGGGSAHKRLMTLLSKKARIVLTSEYRTTKACPACRAPDEKMVQPKGNATRVTKNGVARRQRIHGLSQCGCCGRLWSRDYAASLNIGRFFLLREPLPHGESGGVLVSLETTGQNARPRSSCSYSPRRWP